MDAASASSSSSSEDDKRKKKEKKKRGRAKKARRKERKERKRAKKASKHDAPSDDDDEFDGWAAVDAQQRRRGTDAATAWRDRLFGACAEDGGGEDPFGGGWGDAEEAGGGPGSDWFEHVSRQRSRARDREDAARAREAQEFADAQQRRPEPPPTPPRATRPPTPPVPEPTVASLYAVLGVARGATDRDLRTSYRRLALQHHPDQGGNEATMARLNHARDVLCDPLARRNHDRELGVL